MIIKEIDVFADESRATSFSLSSSMPFLVLSFLFFFFCFKMMRWKKENFKRKGFLLCPSFLRFLRLERSLKRVDDEDKCSRCVTTVQENVQIEKKKGSGE